LWRESQATGVASHFFEVCLRGFRQCRQAAALPKLESDSVELKIFQAECGLRLGSLDGGHIQEFHGILS
jgi:hypothetical protein